MEFIGRFEGVRRRDAWCARLPFRSPEASSNERGATALVVVVIPAVVTLRSPGAAALRHQEPEGPVPIPEEWKENKGVHEGDKKTSSLVPRLQFMQGCSPKLWNYNDSTAVGEQIDRVQGDDDALLYQSQWCTLYSSLASTDRINHPYRMWRAHCSIDASFIYWRP